MSKAPPIQTPMTPEESLELFHTQVVKIDPSHRNPMMEKVLYNWFLGGILEAEFRLGVRSKIPRNDAEYRKFSTKH